MLLKLGPLSNTLTYTLILLFKNSSASNLLGVLGHFRFPRHLKTEFSLNALVPRKAVGWRIRAAESLHLKGRDDMSLCASGDSAQHLCCAHLKNAHSSVQI